jgi:hypothetical protein
LNNDASCYIGVSGVSGSGADVVANGYDDSLWAYHYQEGGGVMKAHCGTISDSTPVNLTVDVYASGSYSVLMNGAATDCTDLGLNGGAGGWYTDMWFADENGPNPCNAYFDNLHGESISE